MARERRVDVLTCAGDLYEQERFVPDTANFLVSTFAGLQSIPVLLAPGNHDWLGPASIYATAKWSPNVFVFHEDRLSAFELRAGLMHLGSRSPRSGEHGQLSFAFSHGFDRHQPWPFPRIRKLRASFPRRR